MDTKFSSTLETLEPAKLKFTVTISPEAFREGLQLAYNKNKGRFNVQGFRQGKAPRKMIEQMYGREVFYEDAMNELLPDAYESALDEHNIEPVYRPELEFGSTSETEGAVFYATVYIRPEVEVDGYYGLTYPKVDIEPTEDEILNVIAAEQEKNANQESVDRPAEMGDVVIINFKGYIDDVAFEGGEGFEHSLTLGSKNFIDTFEEQLVGHKPGDDVVVNVTFPEEYHSPDYAGKAAKFEVEVIDVRSKNLPELNDEFASNVSEFETLAEYREDVSKKIKASKENNLDNVMASSIVKQLVEKAKMDVPEAMYLARVDELLEDIAANMKRQGMDMEMYMRFTQSTPESIRESLRPRAEEEVKNILALEAVATKEAMTISDEEFIENIAKMTMQEKEEAAKLAETIHPNRRKVLERSMLCEKALDFLKEKAIAVDEPMPEVKAVAKKEEGAE